MLTCCSNKLYSATFSMNASILHRATPLTLVFAGSLSEAGSANTCNHSLSSFESNPTKTIQTWLARLFFTVRTGATRTRTRTRSLSIPVILNRFLLGTGRMPHPVGGDIGVTLRHCREKGTPTLNRSHHVINQGY